MHSFFWRHYAQGVMVWELLSVYLQGQYTLHKIRFLVFPNIRNTHFDQKNVNSYITQTVAMPLRRLFKDSEVNVCTTTCIGTVSE